MSNYLTIPINENGVVVDSNIDNLIEAAMSSSFKFNDIYIYSHGWSLDATRMMDWYNRFSIEYNKRVIDSTASQGDLFTQPPVPHSLGVGIHWPSMISEDTGNILDYLQQLTFYTMEKRADSVGAHGVYSVLRLILQNPNVQYFGNVRINLIGHSFGCKVVSSALEQIYQDVKSGLVEMPDNIFLNVVLLQAAFGANQLDEGGCYGDIDKLKMRLLITHSDLDKACGQWFDAAHLNVNFFHTQNPAARALGAVGPTETTQIAVGEADLIDVDSGFSAEAMKSKNKRLIVANLTPLHAAHGQADPSSDDKWSGHHSDIFLPEIYNMVAGFFYNNNIFPKTPARSK